MMAGLATLLKERHSHQDVSEPNSDPFIHKTNNYFQILEPEDIDELLARYAKTQKRLMVPVDGGTLIIRSSHDNKRHLVSKRFADGSADEIIASDGYFGIHTCGDIKKSIWGYRDLINRYFKKMGDEMRSDIE